MAAALAISCASAVAWPEDSAMGVYVEGGHAPHGRTSTDSVSAGFVVPWMPRHSLHGGAVTFYADFFISQWRAPLPGYAGKRSYTQIGAVANWRYRFSEGASPWFAEAGIGVTTLNDLYRTPDREFSTRFQFTEQVGFGRSFGDLGQHEISVRLQHFSNANIKKPNPGENFVRLRYLYRF